MSASSLPPADKAASTAGGPRKLFPIDPSQMPVLPVRKGLLILDFQSDFLDSESPLHITEPEGFVSRTLALAQEFRKKGDVIWACSEFAKSRPIASENILVSDEPAPLNLPPSYARRRAAKPTLPDPTPIQSDPEAFLSQGGAACVRSPSGSQVPAHIKDSMGRRDVTFIKSHYSAFKSGQLLQLLRGKLVTKLYICGSLTNVGVYATAVDAAMYGYDIAIVDDCCGYRSVTRQKNAMDAMFEATGCDVVPSTEVPKDMLKAPEPPTTEKKQPSTAQSGGLGHRSSDLHEKLAALNLGGPKSPRTPRQPLLADTSSQNLEVDPDAQPASHAKSDSGRLEASSSPQRPGPRVPASSSTHVSSSVEPRKGDNKTSVPELAEALKVVSLSEKDAKEEPSTTPAPAATEPKIASKPISTGNMTPTALQDEASETSVPLCEGDTTVIHDLLPPAIEDGVFDKLKDEVQWQRMSHQGGEVPRLVAVQGAVAEDGSMPVYRHPSDEAPPLLPFSPTVLAIKAEAEKHLGHPLNHVLIQYYRDGSDYISEHSDKTLDIVKGSYITNVSLGAERTMVFRTKRVDKDPSKAEVSSSTPETSSSHADAPPATATDSKRKIQRAKLPHNSLCRMGLVTNERWLHAIRQDKRMDRDKTDVELAYSGGRISLTFRNIGTFLNKDSTLIWGQGATSKTREGALPTTNGQSDEMVSMLIAFGKENHSSNFDWDEHYGKGFDVLHMRSSPRLFFSPDPVVNMRVALMLAEFGTNYAKGSMAASNKDGTTDADNSARVSDASPIKFVDNDASKSTVQGDLAIMLYLDSIYGAGKAGAPQADVARSFTRFQQGLGLLERWRAIKSGSNGEAKRLPKSLKKELAAWEVHAAEAAFIAGPNVSLADFAVWPVLHDIVKGLGSDVLDGTTALAKYYQAFLEREPVKKVLEIPRPSSGDATDKDREGSS